MHNVNTQSLIIINSCILEAGITPFCSKANFTQNMSFLLIIISGVLTLELTKIRIVSYKLTIRYHEMKFRPEYMYN